MIVVSDTSPINYLIEIGQFNILATVFDRVIIPKTVFAELTAPAAPARNRNLLGTLPSNFEIRAATRVDSSLRLDPGECEAISLAAELSIEMVLLDDQDAREAAESRGLRAIGTIGVLEMAAREGLVDFESALEDLRRTKFFISQKIVDQVLARWRKGKLSR